MEILRSMYMPPAAGLRMVSSSPELKSVKVTSPSSWLSVVRGESRRMYVMFVVPSTSSMPLICIDSSGPVIMPLKLTYAFPKASLRLFSFASMRR